MYEEDKQLAELCGKLAAETQNAGQWLGGNSELVGRELGGHLKEMRRAARIFNGCKRAANST